MRLIGAFVVVCALVGLACSKKTDAPKAGSGSPATPAADAGVSATTVDGGAGTAATTGDGGAVAAPDDAAAPDDKRAAIPEGGILLATHTKKQLVIAKLDRSGVKVQHGLDVSEMVAFGWLDAQTLVVKEPYGKNEKAVVMKLVDGKPVEEVELDEEWGNSELLVTRSGEVWLERCVVAPEGPEPCSKLAYQRLYPSKKSAKKRPKDVDPERVTGGFTTMGELGAREEVAGPADVKLQTVKLVAKAADMDASRDIVGVKCTRGKATSTHPDPKEHDPAYGYTATKTRWVLTEPAIYEVRADVENPVGQIENEVLYFKPCEVEPLDGFIGLGGPVWGQWLDEEPAAKWTFRVGTTDIGTLEGTALRANR